MSYQCILNSIVLIFILSLGTSQSTGISMLHSTLLKPLMFANKWSQELAPCIFGEKKDYVCTLTDEQKKILCQKIFNDKKVQNELKVKVMYSGDVQGFKYDCVTKKFDCYLNNYLNMNYTQQMLLCPLQSSNPSIGGQIKKYYVSTNYTSHRVFIAEANESGKLEGTVFAVVGLYDINLLDLKL